MSGVIFDGKVEGEGVFDEERVVESFSDNKVERAVVVTDDGGHAVLRKRDGPEAFEVEVEGDPDEKGGKEGEKEDGKKVFGSFGHIRQ
jgi:hypothetical protein